VCFGVDDAAGGVQAVRTLGIRGMNVTMPHKQAVMPQDAASIPVEIRLVRETRCPGCRAADGIRMLLHPLCGQVEPWTGRPAPFETMSAALLEAIAGTPRSPV
jgi:shikimate dehydrogenase